LLTIEQLSTKRAFSLFLEPLVDAAGVEQMETRRHRADQLLFTLQLIIKYSVYSRFEPQLESDQGLRLLLIWFQLLKTNYALSNLAKAWVACNQFTVMKSWKEALQKLEFEPCSFLSKILSLSNCLLSPDKIEHQHDHKKHQHQRHYQAHNQVGTPISFFIFPRKIKLYSEVLYYTGAVVKYPDI
jgi:hypothetical protein